MMGETPKVGPVTPSSAAWAGPLRLLKDGENGAGSIARLELGGEKMKKLVILAALGASGVHPKRYR